MSFCCTVNFLLLNLSMYLIAGKELNKDLNLASDANKATDRLFEKAGFPMSIVVVEAPGIRDGGATSN